jgi:drug/metabolite transporter (DMT)-like permease
MHVKSNSVLSKTMMDRRVMTPSVALFASTFALGSTLIRFAYEAGADTFAVTATRATIAAIGLVLILATKRVPLRLVRREFLAAVFIGALMAAYVGAMYQSFVYMPIALGVVTFYTYPLMTGVVAWVSGRGRLGLRGTFALPLAFFGLLLALNVSGRKFSPVGASWALLGAVGFTIVLTLSARLFSPQSDAQTRTSVMLASAAITAITAIFLRYFLDGSVTHFPGSVSGWSGLIGSSFCYLIGITGLMYVLPVVGAPRVALVMNTEPIASIILTFLILGDRLKLVQILGIACVVAAIFLCRSPAQASVATEGI